MQTGMALNHILALHAFSLVRLLPGLLVVGGRFLGPFKRLYQCPARLRSAQGLQRRVCVPAEARRAMPQKKGLPWLSIMDLSRTAEWLPVCGLSAA